MCRETIAEIREQHPVPVYHGLCSLLSLCLPLSGNAESSKQQRLFILLEVGPTWNAGFEKVKRFLASKRVKIVPETYRATNARSCFAFSDLPF